jgi:hypothetical protein
MNQPQRVEIRQHGEKGFQAKDGAHTHTHIYWISRGTAPTIGGEMQIRLKARGSFAKLLVN